MIRSIQKLVVLSGLALSFFGCQDDRIKLTTPGSNGTGTTTNVTSFWATPDVLSFTSKATSAQVNLSVSPQLPVVWQLGVKPIWLNVSPTAGTVGTGPLTFTAATGNLLVGKLSDKVTIIAGSKTVVIPVTLDITESTAVAVTPASPFFGLDLNTQQISIKNNSGQSVNWQLQPSVGFLTVSPGSGSLSAGQSASLTLALDRTNLESKNYLEHLDLKVGGIKNAEIAVGVANMRSLTGLVIDAEYDRIGDKLYALTTGNKLLQISSAGSVLNTLSLPTLPRCISVGRDGQKAVVGYDGSISVIDLATMAIDATYPISCNALDVVLAPNSYAYVFPTVDQWTTIRCVNLQTGAEVQHTGYQIYAGTKAKLHPSGDYIYGANNGLFPNDVEKYDIRGGQAIRMYDSPYHGDYDFGGEIWMADDGSRMFARGRTVFTLTTDQSTDLRYAAIFPLSNPPFAERIKTLDHTSVTNRVGAISIGPDVPGAGGALGTNSVRFYTGNSLILLDTRALPDFVATVAGTSQFVPSEGNYAFFNSAGTKFIVLIKSKTVSGSADQWAVTTMTVN